MTSPAHAVNTWMRTAGQHVATHPQDAVPDDDAALRIRLIAEEAAELIDAIASGDLTRIAQEAADLVVVTYGTAATYGLDLDRAVAEVMTANFSKFVDGKPVTRADGKVLKGPAYQPPDMERVVELCRLFGRSTDQGWTR
jgi:predicted HAD superfamily Cof-like phosphohydrolase